MHGDEDGHTGQVGKGGLGAHEAGAGETSAAGASSTKAGAGDGVAEQSGRHCDVRIGVKRLVDGGRMVFLGAGALQRASDARAEAVKL